MSSKSLDHKDPRRVQGAYVAAWRWENEVKFRWPRLSEGLALGSVRVKIPATVLALVTIFSFFAAAQTITVDVSHSANHFVPSETWSRPTLRGGPKQRSDGCGHYSHLDDVSARALA